MLPDPGQQDNVEQRRLQLENDLRRSRGEAPLQKLADEDADEEARKNLPPEKDYASVYYFEAFPVFTCCEETCGDTERFLLLPIGSALLLIGALALWRRKKYR